ncbi:MAG: zinc ribbon domain-containing protein, partial [Thermoprotei archaeon]
SEVYMGYPMYITQGNGNEYNTNIWWFRRITRWLGETLGEYGIELYLVPEPYTSLECSVCGNIHGKGRVYRGLYVCEKTGRGMNSDLNASNNIARRVGYRVEVRRILSYIVTHNGLRPITLLRGNARDPSGGNSIFQGGEGSYEHFEF